MPRTRTVLMSRTRSKVLLFRKHLFLFVVGVVSATGWSSLALKVGLNFPSLQDPTMYSSQLGLCSSVQEGRNSIRPICPT
jgi:hypothetical protein